MKGWIRERWLELRWGYSTYLAYAVAFLNLVILLSLRFEVVGSAFFVLVIGLFVGLSAVSIIVGHLHRKWQQATDVLVGNDAMIKEIVRQILEELKK